MAATMQPATTMTYGERMKHCRELAGIGLVDAAIEFGIAV